MWDYVIQHFNNFLQNIELLDTQHNDAITKASSIAKCLCNKYWVGEFNPNYTIFVGSYGKRTAIRPTSDVDLIFLMPWEKYSQYDNYAYNGQSALLQEVKDVLKETFSRTDMRADGQVIQVQYSSYNFEIVPAFYLNNGDLLICDTNNGGNWKFTSPNAEFTSLNCADNKSLGSARMLIKYTKHWKRYNNIDLKSISLEIAACNFIIYWPYLSSATLYNPVFWHDWLVRDFFYYLSQLSYVTIPGTNDLLEINDTVRNASYLAFQYAYVACEYEKNNFETLALGAWKEIFGSQFISPSLLNSSLISTTN